MTDIFYIAFVVFMLAIGPLAAVAVMLRPRLFWRIFLVAAGAGAGLMFWGYAIVDEYWIALVVGAGILLVAAKKTAARPLALGKLEKAHVFFFFALAAYLLMEAARGIAAGDTLAGWRWICFYSLLAAIAFIAAKGFFPFPGIRQAALLACGAGLLYFAAYLSYGIFSEQVRHIWRFDLQGVEWSGTVYAVFPLIVALPAAILLFKYYRFRGRALLLAAVSAPVAVYYDSRTAWLVIFVFLLVAAIIFFANKFIFAGLALFAALLVVFNSSSQPWFELPIYLYEKVSGIVQGQSDTDRYLHYRASYLAIARDSEVFFFGYGLNQHKKVIVDSINELAPRYMPGYYETRGSVRTVGFTALLIDTGFVGLFLLLVNFFLAGIRLLFCKNRRNRLLSAAILVLNFLWLPVSSVLDVILFYFIIMPFGLVDWFSRESEDIHRQKTL